MWGTFYSTWMHVAPIRCPPHAAFRLHHRRQQGQEGETRPKTRKCAVSESPNQAARSTLQKLQACHNGTGCHCEVVTRREIGDVLRYREYGPASRRYSV
eukprot:366512-Chlamydomonas_euryale.AAC.19